MAIVDVNVNEAGLNSLDYVNTILYNFPQKVKKVAVWRAAKRAGAAGKTEAKRYASAVYNIKPSQFTKNTTVTVKEFAGSGGGVAKVQILYSGAMLDLLEFNPTIGDGVTYQARRGYNVHLPHAFDIAAYGGHVFERVGKPRFPIRKKLGPSTPHMLTDAAVKIPLGEKIMSVFTERLEHEIARILG